MTHEKKSQYPAANEDFFRHVNGAWLENTEIPPSQSRWGAFDILAHTTRQRLSMIAEAASEVADDAEKGSDEQLVGDFYQSAIDMERRNSRGLTAVEPLLAQIDGVMTKADLATCMVEIFRHGPDTFFDAGISEDKRNAGWNVFYVGQGGIGLPDRDYYLSHDESMVKIQEQYREYMAALLTHGGRDKTESQDAAERVFKLERALAAAARPRSETRDVEKNYTKYTLEKLTTDFPNMDWKTYFTALGKPDIKDIVVRQPEFLRRLNELLHDESLDTLRDYLEVSLLRDLAPSLDEYMVNLNFDFYGTALSGMKEQKPLTDRAVLALGSTDLTNAIGPLYCEHYFNDEDKARITQIVADVCNAFAARVEALDWMTPETKELTLKKLAGIDFKMGYPDEWLDVSSIDITADDYVQNRMNLTEFLVDRYTARIGEPYDRSEWHMPPTMVNACADLKRDMTFPAAILQYPFYDSTRDDAYNYGAIGAVIGHELSHFFDDQGSKYDLDGNANPWWSDEDRQKFDERANAFAEYFGGLFADGLQVNGWLTNGENIADVAGVKIAFDAFQASDARVDSPAILDGLTPEQRFFTGYARVWPTKSTPEYAKNSNLSDPHSPAEVRVNGVLALNSDFHAAFDVKPGDAMYVPDDQRPELW